MYASTDCSVYLHFCWSVCMFDFISVSGIVRYLTLNKICALSIPFVQWFWGLCVHAFEKLKKISVCVCVCVCACVCTCVSMCVSVCVYVCVCRKRMVPTWSTLMKTISGSTLLWRASRGASSGNISLICCPRFALPFLFPLPDLQVLICCPRFALPFVCLPYLTYRFWSVVSGLPCLLFVSLTWLIGSDLLSQVCPAFCLSPLPDLWVLICWLRFALPFFCLH